MKFYYWIIVLVCCVFSAFFSCTDMVYGVVDKNKLEKESEKNKFAKLALDIANDYELSISSILFGNNIVNILASSVATIIGISLSTNNPSIGSTIATIILTVVIIIFCEFLPKIFAKRFSYKLSLIFSVPVCMIKYLFFIFTWPVSKFFKWITSIFQKKSEEEDKIDEEVLTEMVDTMEEENVLDENEAEIVRSAIDLHDIEVHEIMTPRVDVFAIDVDADLRDIIKEEEVFVHSRVPVFKDTIDNIIGVLPIKKLSKHIFAGEDKIVIEDLIIKPIVVPRNRQVLDLLQEFKKTKTHIAIIIDEYGGTEGIVTMEDILEEIVGDIFDETDKVEEEALDNHDGSYIVDGSMNLDDCFELIDYRDEVDTDYTTIGGFCQEILDRFARENDEFDFDRFHIKILRATNFTVEKLEIIDTKYLERENDEEKL